MKTPVHLIVSAMLLTCCFAASCSQQDADLNTGWTYWSDRQPEQTVVDLPHDAMIVGQRNPDARATQATAFFEGDVYHYQKTLNVSAEMLKRHVTLQFEGIYRNPKVYVNDQLAGGTAYGYIPFEVCLDGLLKEGDNVIRIDADNSKTPNTRWYSGGGIYRPIHLLVQDREAYIRQVKVLTKGIEPAIIALNIDHEGGTVRTAIRLNGVEVARAEGAQAEIVIPNAQLWSAASPTLYEASVELLKDGKVVETRTETFGIRTIAWNGQEGLLINGKPELLRGGCIHHDNGILGAREYDDVARRKVAIMKSYGFNAIRSAHNPISPALLRACDELGMYIMDEMWDMWFSYKNPEDYAKDFMANWQDDIDKIAARDYNHPSVIMYSIGNEVVEPTSREGLEMEQKLVERFHEADGSRPVTCGMNLTIQMMNVAMGQNLTRNEENGSQSEEVQKLTSEEYNKMVTENCQRMAQAVLHPAIDQICSPGLDLLDIAGYNYGVQRAALDAKLHPDRVQVGSETYCFDIATSWPLVEQLPQLIGDFMWTGWDHLGEMGIGYWYYGTSQGGFIKPYPWMVSGAGAIDLLGNPTGEALWAKAVWEKTDEPLIGVCPFMDEPLVKAMWRGTNSIPCWSWPGQEGKVGQVEVFTSAPICRLYVNDVLIGEQKVSNCRAVFDVTYQPGTLKAVTIGADGKEHTAELKSAEGETQIAARAEGKNHRAGQLIFVDVALTGENGVVIGNRDTLLKVSVEGGELLAFGSARPMAEENFLDGIYSTWYGLAQAIVKTDKPGMVKITINGEGLEECVETISVE